MVRPWLTHCYNLGCLKILSVRESDHPALEALGKNRINWAALLTLWKVFSLCNFYSLFFTTKSLAHILFARVCTNHSWTRDKNKWSSRGTKRNYTQCLTTHVNSVWSFSYLSFRVKLNLLPTIYITTTIYHQEKFLELYTKANCRKK